MTAPALPAWAEKLKRRSAGGVDRCLTKVRYGTEVHARSAGRNVLRAPDTPNPPRRMFVYLCQHCRGWHLTRKPNAAAAVTAQTSHEGVAFQ